MTSPADRFRNIWTAGPCRRGKAYTRAIAGREPGPVRRMPNGRGNAPGR